MATKKVKKALCTGAWVNFCLYESGPFFTIEKITKDKSNYVYQQSNVKEIIGDWSVSWGPVANMSFFSSYADNCMMISRKSTNDNLYICIAGTTRSLYTKLVEDMNITFTTKWPYSKGNLDPRISNGMMIGLDHLINMQGHNQFGSKCTVLDYIKNEVELYPKMKVHVSGISLGGSLSHVFGLYLYENQVIWNPNGTASLLVHSFAAFTVGNNDFRIYYEDRLGKETTRTWNNLDVSPYMFNPDTLSQVPTLYEPYIPNNIFIDTVVKIYSCIAGNNGYIQVLPDAPPLVGQYHPIVQKDKEVGMKSMYGDFERFLEEGTYQHAKAYFDLLDLGDLWNYFPLGINLATKEDVDLIIAISTEKIRDYSFVDNSPKTKKQQKKYYLESKYKLH